MILMRLPYRVQIPLGLSLAVVLTALLVMTISARIFAQTTKQEILSTLNRVAVLLVAQAQPLLKADDVWRVFSLLRDTAQLIPSTAVGYTKLAVLDTEGRVFAASSPAHFQTGQTLREMGVRYAMVHQELPQARDITMPQADGAVIVLQTIKSDDGLLLGYVLIEVDAPVFLPNWPVLIKTALIGIALAVIFLVPMGWWVGRRMTRPIAEIVSVIEQLGSPTHSRLQPKIPKSTDPELARIGDAVSQLIGELEERKKAQTRALSAERLAAVGRMTASIAHEINNPLAGLLTAAQTLRLHGDTADTRQRTLDLLERGLKQIKATVTSLLPQAKLEHRTLEPDDLDDVVTLARAAGLSPTARIEASLDVESALRVPSTPMRQVMLNLLLNGLKATGGNGRVNALLKADAEIVEFSVFSAGKHLPPERFKEILATESGRDPQGFGLWVCQELAVHYGGGFELDASVTDGTRLIFWLPNREIHKG